MIFTDRTIVVRLLPVERRIAEKEVIIAPVVLIDMLAALGTNEELFIPVI
jgi:hypothetical protein